MLHRKILHLLNSGNELLTTDYNIEEGGCHRLEISSSFVQTEIFLYSSHRCSLCTEYSNYYIQCDVHLKVLPHEAFRTASVSLWQHCSSALLLLYCVH